MSFSKNVKFTIPSFVVGPINQELHTKLAYNSEETYSVSPVKNSLTAWFEQIIAGVPNRIVVLITFNTIPRNQYSSIISFFKMQSEMPEMEENTPAMRDMRASGPGFIGQGTFSHN